MKPEKYQQLLKKKKDGIPLTMITAYDYPTARIEQEAGIDVILVGDSVGTNVLGYRSEQEVTMSDMLHHLKAVVRGAPDGFIMVDIPYNGARDPFEAFENARILVDAGADMVKIEGWEDKKTVVGYLAEKGIPVCGHIGYNPQFHGPKGRIFGKDPAGALQLLRSARVLEQAGAQMFIVEKVPEELARSITSNCTVPIIGIGSGRFCDGQVLVVHDIIGLAGRPFKHAREYANVGAIMADAVQHYKREVESRVFPAEEHVSHISAETTAVLYRETGRTP